MSIRKKIKWLVLGTLGIGLLLFLTLIIHITVMVYHKAPLPFAHVQMARVDFQQPLSQQSVDALHARLNAQNGVKTVYFNPKDKDVVYTFDNRQNNAEAIYQNAIHSEDYTSKPYVVSAKDMENGCPVMNSNSFYYKLSATISKIVN